jgi:uncharacterized membrane protein
VVIELSTLAVTAAVVYEAARKGPSYLATILAAILTGLGIEVYFTTQYSGYSYGDFLLDPTFLGAHVPIWVGCGWGMIIYTAMAASDRTGLQLFPQVALDALLAVSIDFALDPIAEALGWWHWTRPVPPEEKFYGVPFDNFLGWIMIVGFFSLFIRLGFWIWDRGDKTWRDWLVAFGALLPTVLAVAACQYGLDSVYAVLGEPITFTVIAGSLTVLVCVQSPEPEQTDCPWFLTVVPLLFHGLLLLFLFVEGVYQAEVTLIVLMPLAAYASLTGFRRPVWRTT